MNIFENLSL